MSVTEIISFLCYSLVILHVSCHSLKQILFTYTDRDLKYTKMKSHLQSASVILLLCTYVYLRLSWFLLTYGFPSVQNTHSVMKTLPLSLACTLLLCPVYNILNVNEAPDLRPPVLIGFCPHIAEDSKCSPKRPKASLYSSSKILIDSLLERGTSGSLWGTDTAKGSGLDQKHLIFSLTLAECFWR